jgi:D-alanyl-lipoteichoic acid acyltransferase DltB (MBOAT superfamily)
MLLAASYAFYGSWDWRFLALLLISTIVDYMCGIKIYAAREPDKKKIFLFFSIFCNLAILGIFKYFNFFAQSFQELLSYVGFSLPPIALHIVLPVGISFYTFKTLSYTIDVYRGEMQPTRKLIDYALFVSFFPQILAGPIDRARDLIPQIASPRTVTLNKFYEGSYLIFWGLFEKVFIADNLARIVDNVFSSTPPYNGVNVLLAIYALAIQVFCDFDGYSNIARGIGKYMGFEIMINFNMPYLAPNLTELWRRWHISLSGWFRDYVYTPLAINRRYWGTWGTVYALFICFVLIGLWHGPEWKYILFGILQGIVLSYEVITRKIRRRITRQLPAFITNGIGVMFTFSFFSLCCVLFKAIDVSQALRIYYDLIFNFSTHYNSLEFLRQILLFSLPMVLMQFLQFKKNDLLAVLQLPAWGRGVSYFIMYYLLVVYGVEGGKEFIYFQF